MIIKRELEDFDPFAFLLGFFFFSPFFCARFFSHLPATSSKKTQSHLHVRVEHDERDEEEEEEEEKMGETQHTVFSLLFYRDDHCAEKEKNREKCQRRKATVQSLICSAIRNKQRSSTS